MKNFRNSRELRNIRAINVFNPFFINIIGGRIRFPRKTGEALYYFPEDGVEQAVVSPAAISITVGRAGCSYRDRTDHTG